MASITKQGRGYKITVSFGFDANGHRHREFMTWIPDPKMTEKQIEKELNRQATLFEERVRTGSTVMDGSIRFEAWAKKYMAEYAEPNLKAHTVARYRTQLSRICMAIGHIKLKDLKPGHISKFYANLQEAGIRDHEIAKIKIDLTAWRKQHNVTLARLSEESGVSEFTLKKLAHKEPILKDKALAVAAAMGMPAADVFAFERDMRPLKATSIQSYHHTLSSVLSVAVEQGYIQTNPAANVKLPSAEQSEPAYLDEPEAKRLLELLEHEPIRWRAPITFDLLSGLRRGEILGLRWQDVDLDNHLIQIRQTWNYVPAQKCYVDTPKSRKSKRPLKISQTAISLLLEYKAWQEHQREILGDAWIGDGDRIFTAEDGGPVFPDALTHWFHSFVRRNGFSADVHLHSLRHTYASLQIAEGIPLIVVSHNLGHAQASTTSNIYAHVIASAEAKAATVMDRFADVVPSCGTKVSLNGDSDTTTK